MPSKGLLSLSLIYSLCSWWCSPECYLSPLLPEHTTSSCPPSPSIPLLQRCSSAGPSMACTAAGAHLFPDAELGICTFWVSEGSCWPIPPFAWVFLDSSSALDFIDSSTQSGAICKLSDHALHSLWQGLDKDAKQVRSNRQLSPLPSKPD